MTSLRLVLPVTAVVAVGLSCLPCTANADSGGGRSGGAGNGGIAAGRVAPGAGGGAVVGGGRGGGFAGGGGGGAVAGRIAPPPAARGGIAGATPAGNIASSGTSGSATPQAGNGGFNDPQSAFLASAVAWPLASGRDDAQVELVSSFKDKDGRPCREYRETVNLDGGNVAATGKVCQLASGSWALTE
jgi:hypothetical protein